MKKNLFMAGALVAALTVVTGCSNEDLATDNGNARDERVGGITEITASTPNENPNTRLVYEHLSAGGLKVNWKAYDVAAPEQFYMKTFANSDACSYLSLQKPEATTQTSNCFFDVQFRTNGGGWNPSSGLWSGDEAHAIYPVKEYGGEFLKSTYSVSSVTIDLPLAAQTGKLADMKDFDYMTATGTANANTGEEGGSALKLTFNHRVAVLCLKGLTFEGLTGDASISSFSFSGTGVKPSAKLTMAKGVMTDVIGFSSINDAAITTGTSTFAITDGKQTENAYICFFPNGNMTGQEMTVSATVGSDTYSGTFTAPTFVEGNMYTATVTMKKAGPSPIPVKNFDFEDWSNGIPTGWNVMTGAICAKETTDTNGKTSAVKITQEAKDAAAKVGQYVNGLSGNASYTVSFKYKVLNTNKADTSFRAFLRWQKYVDGVGTWVEPINDTEKNLMQSNYAPDNLNQWSTYTTTITAPAETTTIHVDLRVYNGAAVLVNDISVKKN